MEKNKSQWLGNRIMKSYLFLILISLFFIACQKEPQTKAININEFKDAHIALLEHNRLRRIHFSNTPLQYSKKVEYDAQQYANYLAKTGQFEHDPKNLSHKYGENLYAFSLNKTPNLARIIQKWYDEKQYYTYGTQACVRGKMCGHYTQIIWKESKLLGCASAQYKKGRFKGGYVTVCKYYPYGNIVGQNPY